MDSLKYPLNLIFLKKKKIHTQSENSVTSQEYLRLFTLNALKHGVKLT